MPQQEQSALGPVTWLDSVDSTNRELVRRLGSDRAAAGTILAAREQTAGRGRYDRSWSTAPQRDLAMSLAWRAPDPERAASLSMAAALAVSDVLKSLDLPARTKWPNDVYVRGRKIAGLLAEVVGTDGLLVVGIGLNIGMTQSELDGIDRPATSVVMESGWEYDVAAVLDLLLPCLAQRLTCWHAGGFEALREDWEAAALWGGERVTVQEGDTAYHGTLVGYGSQGQLRLKDGEGTVHDILTGDLLRREDRACAGACGE